MAQVATPSPKDGDTSADPTQRRFRGSAKISEYELMQEKLGEGTFGVVSKARSKKTGAVVALKKIIMHNEKDGFPITALREVKLLKMLSHPNILRLEEMAVERPHADEKGKSGKRRAILYMVMPYMDHDLSGMLNNPSIRFDEGQIKCYMQQLLEGVRYLHDSHILHRDMKAANILISNRGVLQIADFGLARHYEGMPPQPGRGNGEAVRDYTSLVVTRWYRPPELLLTLRKYTPAIDMWGVGCIFAEMFEKKPILEGKTDIDQCVRIFQLVGSPSDQSMPGWSELPGCEGRNQWDNAKGDIDKRFGPHMGTQGLSLLKQLLRLDWKRRINAIDALQHEYFTARPLPSRPEDLPRYEDSHELDNRRRGQEKPRNLPPAPAGGTSQGRRTGTDTVIERHEAMAETEGRIPHEDTMTEGVRLLLRLVDLASGKTETVHEMVEDLRPLTVICHLGLWTCHPDRKGQIADRRLLTERLPTTVILTFRTTAADRRAMPTTVAGEATREIPILGLPTATLTVPRHATESVIGRAIVIETETETAEVMPISGARAVEVQTARKANERIMRGERDCKTASASFIGDEANLRSAVDQKKARLF